MLSCTPNGLHILIMDLHKEINRLQSEISTEVIEGVKAYGVTEADRSLITAFMTGVNRTAPLKFDHPGLATTAARSGSTLLIQNDLGTTDAHVLVVRITGRSAVVTHTDIHVQRLRFFQSWLAETGRVAFAPRIGDCQRRSVLRRARTLRSPEHRGTRSFSGASRISPGVSDRLEQGAQAIAITGPERTGCENSRLGCGSRAGAIVPSWTWVANGSSTTRSSRR